MDEEILKKYNERIEFFIIFSRLEYSLKAEGFFKTNRNAEPDWMSFADNIEDQINEINEKDEFKKSINFILNNPPQVQIIENGKIDWENRSASQGKDVKDLFIYINRIRNNLFHGGKFNSGVLKEFDRDSNLIKNALIILKKIINFNDKVRDTFNYNFSI